MGLVDTEIIASAFEATTEEMCAGLIRTAYSPNIKERADCCTSLLDVDGRTLSLTSHGPAHLGSTLGMVGQVLRRFPLETLRPGDILLANDPYIVGVGHLNDITVTAPIFYEGRPVAFGAVVAHHSDVGGRVPGSEAGDSTSIFQEGVRLPPLQLYSAGKRREDILELVLLNSRTPHFTRGDLMAQVAAIERGTQRLTELLERYGQARVHSAIDEILDATERRARARIRERLREGTYSSTDWLDEDGISDEPVKFAVTVRIDDGQIHMDFSDCSPQLETGKNIPFNHTMATVYYALKVVVDPNLPTNEGFFRVVDVVAPAASVVNPRPPAAVGSRALTSQILADVLLNALGQAAPARSLAASGPYQGIILSGWDAARKRYFVDYENFSGGQGARIGADGMDAVHVHMSNTSNLPIECMESEFPVRVERYELVPDSGGPGRFRGGLGVRRDLRILADNTRLTVRGARQRFAAQGLDGGEPGSLGAFILNPGTVEEQTLRPTFSEMPLRKGDLLRVVTPGGGGYGPAIERDARLVERDVSEGKASISQAARYYGNKA